MTHSSDLRAAGQAAGAEPPLMRARWTILALLFAATTINYLDRIVFSVLVPVIRAEMGFTDQQYGYINAAFQTLYTIGFLLAGPLIDRVGTRLGYAFSTGLWSLAAAGHVLATGAWSMSFWRAMLGIGEGGNFPAAIKSVGEWFPKQDRAFAVGVFNAGTTAASILGPPLFAWMALAVGWRACFLLTAAIGFVWIVFWWAAPKPLATKEADARLLPWSQAIRLKQTWGFAMAKFFSDPVWWFYLYWLPPYFSSARQMDLKQIGWALPVIYTTAAVGSVAGGWLSGALIRRGWAPGKARKMGMAVFAVLMPLGALSVLAASPLLAIALISVAAAAHQGWSANLYATTSDVFPAGAVASVTGIGGFAGGVGGILFSALVPGYVVQNFGYTPVFLVLGAFHLTGLLIFHRLMGDVTPLEARPQV